MPEVATSAGSSAILSDARSTANTRTLESINQLERASWQALVKPDVYLLDEIWADDYSLTTPDGTRLTREDCLAGLCDGTIRFEAFDADALQFQIDGDDVVVRGRAHVKCRLDLHDLDAAERYLAIYSRRGDGWEQVATVATRTKTDTRT